MYEQAQQQGQPFPGGSPFGGGFGFGGEGGAWTINMGGPGGARTMSEDEMRDMFGERRRDPFSDFFRTFFGGGGGAAAKAADAAGAPRGVRKGATSSRRRSSRSRRPTTARCAASRSRSAATRAASTSASRRASRTARACAPPAKAKPARSGGASGDLFLRVRIKPHPVFERKGDDLYMKVALPVTTAVLGGEAQVPTITGSVRLKVPETTQPGQIFRLKGHGMPLVGKPDTKGDLYATVDIQLPRSLSKEQREAWEQIKKYESRLSQ